MNQERYQLLSHKNHLNFEFVSEGPNGKIKKIVRFSPENIGGATFFNLAFGHWDEEIGDIDDQAISNNKDTIKILATVAETVIAVTEYFPDMMVAAQGSTPGRTRLYQMGIAANLNKIKKALEVFGLNKGRWEPFTRNINYEAFSVKFKETV
ncbi:MAG: hypothetical protein WDO15_09230 [Bacteroidota bacterium]